MYVQFVCGKQTVKLFAIIPEHVCDVNLWLLMPRGYGAKLSSLRLNYPTCPSPTVAAMQLM
jgi:hypothetical protein